jgi:hypothetical protein
MAQDTTPAVIIRQGDGSNQTFSVPFDKGEYGVIRVAFVRRGLTDYEYNPTTYTVDGYLYAWEVAGTGLRYTKTNDDKVYTADNVVIDGLTISSMFDSSIKFSDDTTGYRAYAEDIKFHSLVEWLGEPLTTNDWICIVRDTQSNQPYTYPNNQKHIEGALDNLSRQIQELKAQSEISLKVDPTYEQDSRKLNAIDWLNTIARSTDGTARSFRYKDMWLEYSTDNPDKAEDQKSWTRVLNTNNITTVREFYNEETGEHIPQYSKDGGVTWVSFTASIAENTYSKSEIDNKITVINAGIDGNTQAIQKTRDDYIAADSEIHQILNSHTNELTTLRGNQASLGDQVAVIESKIPESASGSNPLITKQQLLEEEMDIRDDMNQTDGELQAQITAQAAAIATLDGEKLDKNQGDINAGKYLRVGADGYIELTAQGGGGGSGGVEHDESLVGSGSAEFPLKVSKNLSLEKVSISDGTRDVLSAMSTNMARELFPDYTFFGEGTTITSQWALNNPDINRLEFLTPITFHGWMPDVADDIAMKPISAWSLVSGYQVLENFVSFTTASSQTMAGALVLPELTVETPEGALNISVTAGVATIATNNGLDIASQTKFDTAPTTDDSTTWENALDTSLVRKAQVAAAIGSAASITIRNWQ